MRARVAFCLERRVGRSHLRGWQLEKRTRLLGVWVGLGGVSCPSKSAQACAETPGLVTWEHIGETRVAIGKVAGADVDPVPSGRRDRPACWPTRSLLAGVVSGTAALCVTWCPAGLEQEPHGYNRYYLPRIDEDPERHKGQEQVKMRHHAAELELTKVCASASPVHVTLPSSRDSRGLS